MEDGSDAQPCYADGIAQLGAEPVYHRSRDAVHDGIRQYEREDNTGVLDIAQVKLLDTYGGGYGKSLTVQIVYYGSQENQADHHSPDSEDYGRGAILRSGAGAGCSLHDRAPGPPCQFKRPPSGSGNPRQTGTDAAIHPAVPAESGFPRPGLGASIAAACPYPACGPRSLCRADGAEQQLFTGPFQDKGIDCSLVLGSGEADVGSLGPQLGLAGAGGVDPSAIHLQPFSDLLELTDLQWDGTGLLRQGRSRP